MTLGRARSALERLTAALQQHCRVIRPWTLRTAALVSGCQKERESTSKQMGSPTESESGHQRKSRAYRLQG